MTNFRRTLDKTLPLLLLCAIGACGDDEDGAKSSNDEKDTGTTD